MNEIKTIFGITAIILTFVGYVPYIWSILKKKTKPHLYSWLVWVLDAFIIFVLQVTHGAGIGAYTTLAAGFLCLLVLVLTLINKGKSEIKPVDTFFLTLALIALVIWLFAKQPLVSALLITVVDLLGFVPTIRKSWNNPFSENIFFYIMNTLRFALAFFAMQQYSIITAIYPVIWFVVISLFSLMLVVRRKLTI